VGPGSEADASYGRGHRCPDCRLHLRLCLCAELPRIATRTRLVLLVHQLELRKTTNTGHLALRCLGNSQAVVRGRPLPGALGPAGDGLLAHDPGSSTPPRWLLEAERPALLFPAPEARELDQLAPEDRPGTLIVPDGTWSQASRARNRIPGLGAITCVRLAENLISAYRLRRDRRPGRLSTLEAIAHALGALEGLEGLAVKEALLAVHRAAVERTLSTNGRLAL